MSLPGFRATTDREPYDFYDAARAEGELVWDAQMHSWLLPGYDVCKQAFRDDERLFMSHERLEGAHASLYGGQRALSGIGGAEHWALHECLARALAPARIAKLVDTVIAPLIETTIDRFAAAGQAELVEDFANRIPIRVIAALLGLPWQDEDWIAECRALNIEVVQFFERRMGLTKDGNAAEHEAIKSACDAASRRLNTLLGDLILAKRDGTGDDLISLLWREGPSLFPDWNLTDLTANVRLLFLGGADTTTYAIANAAHLLLTDAPLFAKLRGSTSVAQAGADIAAFAEESLRLFTPVHFRSRAVVQIAQIAGQTLPVGQSIAPMIAAANRDERKFPCPHMVQLDRPHPRDHLTFAYGPRVCVGSHLARAELVTAITGLIRRLPTMRLDTTKPQPDFKGWVMRGWRPLHVIFEAP